MEKFELKLVSSAPPQRLFALLSDAPGWPRWFRPARRVRWAPGPDRVRLVAAGPLTVREVVLEETAPSHHAYSIVSVIPVRDHRADVRLEPRGDGTSITWTTSFTPRVPGTGTLLRHGLRLGVGALARALVAAAERAPGP